MVEGDPDAQGTAGRRLDVRAIEQLLTKRYRGTTIETLERVLVPIPIPLSSLDKTIHRLPRASHHSATFTINTRGPWCDLMTAGCTGKFVPRDYVLGDGIWRELAKGRIIRVEHETDTAVGEVYLGTRSTKSRLAEALQELSASDFLEIDQYGAAAKVLSALVEQALAQKAAAEGFRVRRMPADVARHIGAYYYFDYEFERKGVIKRIEVKSLWGTNTRYARLIHSKGAGYVTSSCKFDSQDIFAVSLFLRTGDIRDFAFARSVADDEKPYGLPRSSIDQAYVHQNPLCEIGNGVWFPSIEDVWSLE